MDKTYKPSLDNERLPVTPGWMIKVRSAAKGDVEPTICLQDIFDFDCRQYSLARDTAVLSRDPWRRSFLAIIVLWLRSRRELVDLFFFLQFNFFLFRVAVLFCEVPLGVYRFCMRGPGGYRHGEDGVGGLQG